MPAMIEKTYDPADIERRVSAAWEDALAFAAGRPERRGAHPFCIVIPPPNVTGSLHMGHALNNTLQDVLCRFWRMRGRDVLWQPGTDHAGIATQMVVERQLMERQQPSRREMGRERFLERVWAWKAESGGVIVNQLKRLGASCDWSRERFTMDEGLSRAVLKVFVTLYNEGLIYRDKRLVNWDPRFQTAISDLEVQQVETKGSLWYIRYPIEGTEESITVATTRPETMLGDTAVAVHPGNDRLKHLIGRTAILPLVGRRIPIIGDDYADPDKGSGAVKITPAHDFNDFDVGRRHHLPLISVLDEEGWLDLDGNIEFLKDVPASPELDETLALHGVERFAARRKIVDRLEAAGLLAKVEPHTHMVPHGDRSGEVIEPFLKDQWYVDAKALAVRAMAAVEDGRTVFVPKNWEKTYFDWMENIQPWCISRQIWWGHRIPAWYGPDGRVFVAETEEEAVSRALAYYAETEAITPMQGHDMAIDPASRAPFLTRDEDVLDTWFSSALWPFSTLGWPDQTLDLETFYPTSLLITGFDILFFWVARMIMMGCEFMGDVPFRQVYIHGLVRDAERQKMSKTRGNTIDPLVLTETYGTDAVRMGLLMGAAPGTDIVYSDERMESARAFGNKIWNAARLLFLNMERSGVESWVPDSLESYRLKADPDAGVPIEDRWIFSRLNACAEQANRAIDQYRYHEAAQVLWHFFWDEFCDWYLELKKLRFRENSSLDAGWRNLLAAFETALRLLHPVMPFLTEELWQRLAKANPYRPLSIALCTYPQPDAAPADTEAEHEIAVLQDIVTLARALRADMKIDPRQQVEGTLYSRTVLEIAARNAAAILRLANVKLELRAGVAPSSVGAVRSTTEFDLVLHVPKTQVEAQRKRLDKEKEQLEKNIGNSRRQLSDETFLSRAPEKVVQSIRQKLGEYEAQLAKVQAALGSLEG